MDDADDEPGRLVVTVVRTGGLAGIPRRWRVVPARGDHAHWRDLVARCPWDEPAEPTAGADRFVWSIRAQCDGEPAHEARVPDSGLHGAWRDLVDAVRAAA